MADLGNIETMLAGVPDADQRKIQKNIWQYVLKEIRLGRAIDGDPAKNFGGGFFKTTTPAVADTEFSVVHTFGRKPYLLIPVLPLDTVGAKIVRLTVARAADTSRVYLKSPDVSAPVYLYLEG